MTPGICSDFFLILKTDLEAWLSVRTIPESTGKYLLWLGPWQHGKWKYQRLIGTWGFCRLEICPWVSPWLVAGAHHPMIIIIYLIFTNLLNILPLILLNILKYQKTKKSNWIISPLIGQWRCGSVYIRSGRNRNRAPLKAFIFYLAEQSPPLEFPPFGIMIGVTFW